MFYKKGTFTNTKNKNATKKTKKKEKDLSRKSIWKCSLVFSNVVLSSQLSILLPYSSGIFFSLTFFMIFLLCSSPYARKVISLKNPSPAQNFASFSFVSRFDAKEKAFEFKLSATQVRQLLVITIQLLLSFSLSLSPSLLFSNLPSRKEKEYFCLLVILIPTIETAQLKSPLDKEEGRKGRESEEWFLKSTNHLHLPSLSRILFRLFLKPKQEKEKRSNIVRVCCALFNFHSPDHVRNGQLQHHSYKGEKATLPVFSLISLPIPGFTLNILTFSYIAFPHSQIKSFLA